ncbi:restriction endonuclease subunit S [Novosphingobium album (ex Liu et al. 2023)]|uniref:Restriction endonuclease subunit S n=1 Tax=Novosphingobium album (ex Liu et al. 2023) TaxID=3031130 RepID=A0ABT5WN55_9SPHN|nr:restriction endonuclease subunit S [Novosphingobium album (ex Liu et al. 2023)]MDE8651484.1 restriction endonuclease subunit S [Novosphingobium album (ex Liu et al. 2023)]
MSFPAYPDYKDSGITWLDEVPSHWIVAPVKAVATFNDEVLSEATDPELEIDYIEISDVDEVVGIKGTTTLAFGNAPSRARRIVRAGDILVSTVRTYLRAIAPLPQDLDGAIASTGFCVIRGQCADSGFLGYAIRSEAFVAEVISRSVGVSYPAINASDLVAIHISIPSLAEQAAIAAFLDRETAKIDALVAEQERLIALLREKRQAVISHAVTKGLNPGAPMKDSGIEWLGEIPAHWELQPLKQLADPDTSITYGIVQAGPDIPDGIPYIRTSDMSGEELPEAGYLRTSPEIDASYARSKVAAGDLVIAIRATIGKPLIVPEYLAGANLTQGTAKFSPGPAILNRFAQFILGSEGSSTEFQRIAKGATFKEITLDMLRRYKIPVPPIEEQQAICQWLKGPQATFNELISVAEQTKALLQERRAALISAAVTGKIDVRAQAPQNNVVSIDSPRPSNLPPLRTVVGAYAIRELGTMGRMAVMKAGYLAEGHTGFNDLNGRYERFAAGPYDSGLISAMERGAGEICAIVTNEPKDEGKPVTYDVPKGYQPPFDALSALVGEDRAKSFLAMLSSLKGIGRDGVEAVATLYAVWNDLLAAGKAADEDAICNAVLNDWHPEKAKKFKRADLDHWLAWMCRNNLVPDGTAPRTDHQGDLFA